MVTSGRTKIITNYDYINDSNILEVVTTGLGFHLANALQEDFLLNYFAGIQPILERNKTIRPEINNKIVENHAYEIVKFKTGYLLPKPISYIPRKDSVPSDEIDLLNDYMVIDKKESKDKETINMMSKVGIACRGVFPNLKYGADENEAPFKIYTLDPRTAFTIYHGNEPLVGVNVTKTKDSSGVIHQKLQCYTDSLYYEIEDNRVLTKRNHILGYIPIIEYPQNDERMGDFEPVISMLDAINLTESNRLDGVEQFIQALLVFKNLDIKDEDITRLKELGAIKIKDNGEIEANVSYLSQELNQTQVQKLVDNMYDVVLRICGMPQRNGGSSTSDTGSAVYLRDGWGDAETRACDTELIFKASERTLLKLVIKICRINAGTLVNINSNDIEIKFTRRNYENILQKAQVLQTLLATKAVAPRLAFTVCGLFNDPESAYQESEEYMKLNAQQIANKVMTEEQNNNG